MNDAVIDKIDIGRLSLEKLTAKDIEAVSRLNIEGNPRAEKGGEKDANLQSVVHAVSQHRVYVARVGNRIVGKVTFVVFRCDEGFIGCVRGLVIDPEHRRRGIGKQLLGACVEEAKAIGITSLEAVSFGQPGTMRNLFKPFGFSSRTALELLRPAVRKLMDLNE